MLEKFGPRLLTPFALALVTSTFISATAFVFVKTRDTRSIDVTGSAKRRITSDLIEWTAELKTENVDRVAAVRLLKDHVDKTKKYLVAKGITEAELRVSSTTAAEQFDSRVEGHGEDRIERTVSTGWRTVQTITIRSPDVNKIEKVSREVTDLLEQGVELTSFSPEYHYTRLADLKIEMLAEASKDARTRADQMVAAAGGAAIGKLLRADMGVINVNPANSTNTSWQGNNDTTSLDKDILTIVHITFALE
ncbi:MAG: SIMPL domain-containing protein [Deltaproteobacteria bacterium]|nr:SIMPL domain-containing protein [Deltaproteobacteria bacterium]